MAGGAVMPAKHVGDQVIAARVCEARKRIGLSQTQLAERLGVSQSLVLSWERATFTPTVPHLRSLAQVLGVPMDWLAGNEEQLRERWPEGLALLRRAADSLNAGRRDRIIGVMRSLVEAFENEAGEDPRREGNH